MKRGPDLKRIHNIRRTIKEMGAAAFVEKRMPYLLSAMERHPSRPLRASPAPKAARRKSEH